MKLISGSVFIPYNRNGEESLFFFAGALEPAPLEEQIFGVFVTKIVNDDVYLITNPQTTSRSIQFDVRDESRKRIAMVSLEYRWNMWCGFWRGPHTWGVIEASVIESSPAIPCRATENFLTSYIETLQTV